MPILRRWRVAALSVIVTLGLIYYLRNNPNAGFGSSRGSTYLQKTSYDDGKFHWTKHPDKNPVSELIPLPTGTPKKIPAVQAKVPVEDASRKEERLARRAAVLESFTHSWEGYKQHAWLRDEVAPVSGKYKDTFGGWAATLVDSLDTLWIMGLKQDFEMAVKAVEEIDFTTTEEFEINVFETTIRYMGGFLAAYDVSEGKYPVLLMKAVEVGELLMCCFDTPNRMPKTRWDWKSYSEGAAQKAGRALVSELGSLSLEFTRLAQLTGDNKYFDAIQRIDDHFQWSQNSTKLPGMWPISVDAAGPHFNSDTMFTLGGMSDSLYEYFPKKYLLLGGLLEQPKTLYENFIVVAKEHMFFRIFNPKNEALTVSGDIRMTGQDLKEVRLEPQGQHLTCFTGGMVGLAARIFERPEELALAEELTAGCVWAYDSNPNGIAPEIFRVIPCPKEDGKNCEWKEEVWYDGIDALHPSAAPHETSEDRLDRLKDHATKQNLVPGLTYIHDKKYILRPEAIESVFIMYRITGDQKWADTAWRMFQAIEKVSRTEIAAAAIADITVSPDEVKNQKVDSMESFWLAETLKYFYLCFDDWGSVSLDEWVLNTEAHPLRRPGT
ncbi:putative endoplasmic reticulum mannosyl-oligosaccharide 1,2-alpha-mannosidase [Amylocarpus encephaloides]|uniref:alpha-1,2-Mannosidase n=1 Tax=Amylocarpus encephaloides TaxID=45428 RepID=A0A9P8C1A9_9HELO|nr:putative endoplasmic reticulum mannosyl-oligosaccharide 1,2-alpha-mannosidase [Amylocarpus encephaloides]